MKPRINRKRYESTRGKDPTLGSPASDNSVRRKTRKPFKRGKKSTKVAIDTVTSSDLSSSERLEKQDTFDFHDNAGGKRVPSRVSKKTGDGHAIAIATSEPLSMRRGEHDDNNCPDPSRHESRMSTLSMASSVMAIAPLIHKSNELVDKKTRSELARIDDEVLIKDDPKEERIHTSRFSRAMRHFRSHGEPNVVVAAEASAITEWTSTLDFHFRPLESLQDPVLTPTAVSTFPSRKQPRRLRQLGIGSWSFRSKDVEKAKSMDKVPLLAQIPVQETKERLLVSTATTITTTDSSVEGSQATDVTIDTEVSTKSARRQRFKTKIRSFWYQLKQES